MINADNAKTRSKYDLITRINEIRIIMIEE